MDTKSGIKMVLLLLIVVIFINSLVCFSVVEGKEVLNPKVPGDREKVKAEVDHEKVEHEKVEHEKMKDHEKVEDHEKVDDKKEAVSQNRDHEKAEGHNDVGSQDGEHEEDSKKVRKILKKGQGKDGKAFKLANHPACATDVMAVCSSLPKTNNFAVLVCLQDAAAKEDDQVSSECHQLLWEYKMNLTKDIRFDKAGGDLCMTSRHQLVECQGHEPHDGTLVNCMVEHRENVTDEKCRGFLHKMAAIVFSDYRLIKGFYEDCHDDVTEQLCGKLSLVSENDPHTQAEVIECLEDHIDQLKEKCVARIKRVAELSSDDYHMDRALFYSCQADRERFCGEVQSGDGRIYKCLMMHKGEDRMAADCKKKLTVRQKLMQTDIAVNKPLWQHCQADYEKYNCKKGKTSHGQVAHLLICLGQQIADGKEIDQDCQTEMQDMSAQLFDDYKLNPEIVANCEHEIQAECKDNIKPDGNAMDCLMGLAEKKKLSSTCYKSVHDLIKETGAGSHFKVDRPLYQKCGPVILTLCADKKEAMVLSCLMDNAHNEQMIPECAREVFHLQYFLARDFSLDQDLYQDCKKDAETLCSAPGFDADTLALPPGIVMSCLYRSSMADVDKDHKVSAKCGAHVRRVMHERAQSIKLMPEIEGACMHDLGSKCIDKNKAGEEMECLQQNYETLTEECKTAVQNFTEAESEDMELDKPLVEACAPMVMKFCKEIVEEGNSEGVLPCLIEHKHHGEMDLKCAAAVEHWQLTEQKDFKFSHKMKKHCFQDVKTYCGKETSMFETVKCLSSKIRDDVLQGNPPRVSQACRAQIKYEMKQEHEDIALNTDLEKNCQSDLKTFCSHVESTGQAQAEECLREKQKSISKKCYAYLFQTELEETQDQDLDYKLMHTCKPEIKLFCMSEDTKNIMRCLRKFKNDVQMRPECRHIITERQGEEARDFRLDPDLSEFCQKDVDKLCKGVAEKGRGEVLQCLKNKLKSGKLSPDCDDFVRIREQEAALDYRLDPDIDDACRDEIPRVCAHIDPGRGDVLNCLKENYQNIKGKQCQKSIGRLLDEGVEDVHADPHLKDACSNDIKKHCEEEPRGDGKVVACLLDVYNAKNMRLKSKCRTLLTKRIRLWNLAGTDTNLESLSDVINVVHSSPNRHYIYVVTLCILGVIFVGGLCFGRVTKRVTREYKDR